MDTEFFEDVLVESTTGLALSARVILFDDDHHSIDEVVFQIMKAISCGVDHAEALTWEVHTSGKATVYQGDINECLRVSGVLEQIALHTQVEF